MANEYGTLLQTLAASFNDLDRVPDQKNAIMGMVRKDITSQTGKKFGVVSTNTIQSVGTPTNLASGARVGISDVDFDPMNVTLDQHPTLAVAIPSIDQSKGIDDPAIRQIRQKMVNTIGDAVNSLLIGKITTGNFTNTPVDTNSDADIPDAAMAAAWLALADLGVPVDDLGNLFLLTKPKVYSNLLQNDSWTRHSDIGDMATGIRRTARLGTQWGAYADFDPSMPAPVSNVYTSILFHRDAIAFAARAVEPPVDDGTKCVYVYYRGIPIRICVGYDLTLTADVLVADALFGAAVVRPTWGVILKNTP